MDSLDEVLRERIDELAGSKRARQPILSTTGTQVAIAELIARSDRLERASERSSLQIETLTARKGRRRIGTRRGAAESDR